MARAHPQSAGTRLIDGYRPLPGVPDELVDRTGAMRPAWAGLIAHLQALSPVDLARDFARGEQYLRDAGVYFRRYGAASGTPGRDWPLSPLPILLPEAEWALIARGLAQRADLLETVAADLYGENRLVAQGHLPAELVAQNPEWLRPLVGVRPASGHFLHFLAFEIGRGPDGRWWVLGDRTEAPSGAGFALENRVATSRIFPDLFAQSNVHRLSGFFRDFRDALAGLRGDGPGRAGILTAGPMTDTYFEHAYIARYLGLPLLEGGDLTVEGGALKVRTVGGPLPIDVLWRRLDAIWADPLELVEASHLGTPGLISALRQGSVTLVNALGVGVLEAQAMQAFLPGICKAMTGRGLEMPNIATWWCGQPRELAHVRANAHRMLIGPALATRLPFETEGTYAVAGTLRGTTATLDDWLTADAAGLVGQELVTLSSTPVYEDGALVPRPMSIRVFLARTPRGWQAMPGGFARIGASQDTTAIAMRQGSSVADVWVVSQSPVPADTMLSPTDQPFSRAKAGFLPSRAADNLYWLGRYIERTEGIVRLTRAYNARLSEQGSEPLRAAIRDLLKTYGVDAAQPVPEGLCRTLDAAVHSASQIRDRFSIDGWAALIDLQKTCNRMATTAQPGDDTAVATGALLRKIAGFSGLVHENMYHATGWRFLTIGRSLERAAGMADVLARFADTGAPTGGPDLAIEIGDSSMTHRQRYPVATRRESVVDLLALDAQNPRSILFHLTGIRDQSDVLAGGVLDAQMSVFGRQVLALQTDLAVHSPETLGTPELRAVRGDILALSGLLTDAWLV